MSENKKNNEEEIDIGSLFVIIGKGFSKLFDVIGNIFKNLFHFLIETLLFLKKNMLMLFIAAVVGALVGFFLETRSGVKYESSLYVKPNFSSSRQLYNNIQFYDDAVQEKNYALLASIFKIAEEEAQFLKGFNIEPIVNENDIVTSFDDLLQAIDTATTKSYSYNKFSAAFTDFDYKTHKISVISTSNNIFQKLSDPIIASITNNNYFKNLKQIHNKSLKETDSLLRRNLKQADSLHLIYKKVMLSESKKPTTGTNISFREGNISNKKELELFDTSLTLNDNLVEVNKNLSEESEVINIVSNFQPIGHKIKEIERNKAFHFALVSIALTILFLLVIKLNNFLINYKK